MVTDIDKIIPFEFFSYLTILLGIRITDYRVSLNLRVNMYKSCSELLKTNVVPAASHETKKNNESSVTTCKQANVL